MRTAAAVPEYPAALVAEKFFLEEYVAKSRPCVIRGAISHWPALSKWHDKDHLKSRACHHDVFLYLSEYHVQARRLDRGRREVTFAQAIDFLHAEETRLGLVATGAPRELRADLGGLSFLGQAGPPFCYEPARYFFYRNAGTTWHYHPFDETLMCQAIGAKRIGLVSGDGPHNRALRTIFFKEDYYDDASAFDGFDSAALSWFYADLAEGDALYIPPLWWHGIITTREGFGATATVAWRSPPHVVANGIRKMARGDIDMVGKAVAPDAAGLFAAARALGLEQKMALAWERGL